MRRRKNHQCAQRIKMSGAEGVRSIVSH